MALLAELELVSATGIDTARVVDRLLALSVTSGLLHATSSCPEAVGSTQRRIYRTGDLTDQDLCNTCRHLLADSIVDRWDVKPGASELAYGAVLLTTGATLTTAPTTVVTPTVGDLIRAARAIQIAEGLVTGGPLLEQLGQIRRTVTTRCRTRRAEIEIELAQRMVVRSPGLRLAAVPHYERYVEPWRKARAWGTHLTLQASSRGQGPELTMLEQTWQQQTAANAASKERVMVLVGEGHEAPAGEHFTCDLLAVGALLAVRHRREDSWWWALAMPDLLARCLSGVPGTLLLGPDTIDNEQDVIPELFGRWDHDLEPAWSPGEQLSFDSLLGHTGP